jgi:tetratricopeptide (TPR) repeat protein
MKHLFAFYFIAVLSLAFLPAVNAQPNAEANKLAREGSEAAKSKDWDKAIESFRKAAEMDRKFGQYLAAALQQRAAAAIADRRFPEALADFDEAIKTNPRDASILERRAAIEMKMNEVDKALADYNEAIKLSPGEVRYYLYRSYIYETKGDLKNSMADTEKVLKMDKHNAEALSRKERLQKIQAMKAGQQPPPPAPPAPAPSAPPKKR